MVEDLVYDVFKIGEEPIDRVSRRRSIEVTTKPDQRIVQFPYNRANPVDVLVIAMEKATHHFGGF